MYVFKKHVSRRTVLKGVGASIALPLLDAMSPAATAWAATPAGSTPKRLASWRNKAQTALAISFPGPSRKDHRRYAAQLIATIASGLGGRFFDELRDRQSLAYTVHAFASEYEHAGNFISYIATSPEKEDTARQGLLREFARLVEEPVSGDELSRAKRYEIGTNAIRQESGAAILADVLDCFILGTGLSELSEFESRISAVSVEEIQAARAQQ